MELTWIHIESPSKWQISGPYNHTCNLEDKAVVQRIGSPSGRAMVFQVKINNQSYALKLLFATEANPEEKNRLEIIRSVQLGQKYPTSFPKIYYWGRCKSVSIPEDISNKQLLIEAYIWHIRQNILPQVGISKREQKRLEILYRNAGLDPSIYTQYLEDNNIFVPNTLPALFMVSDLGVMDINIWANSTHSLSEWLILIYTMLEAIYYLGMENLTHNDLHLGNILIMSDGRIKIIDLGEAKEGYTRGYDLAVFLSALEYKDLPFSIKSLIKNMLVQVDEPIGELITRFIDEYGSKLV